MAVNFKLGPCRDVEDTSTMGRSWVGWQVGQSDQVTYDVNRGVWNLGARVEKERFGTFSFEQSVRSVVELEGIENVAMRDGSVKQAIVGRVLGPGDEGYDLLIGRLVDGYRNPVTYIDDLLDSGPKTCACNCGTVVTGGRSFTPGHDQKAIHSRIQQGWGGTLGFIRWFDATTEHSLQDRIA